MSERPNDVDRSLDDESTSPSDRWLDAVLDKRRQPETPESAEDDPASDWQSEGRTARLGRPAWFDFDEKLGDAFDEVWDGPTSRPTDSDADDPDFVALIASLPLGVLMEICPADIVIVVVDPEDFERQ